MPPVISCPDAGVLHRLMLGGLPAAEAEPLLLHLEDCPACTQLVRGLQAEDTLHRLVALKVMLPHMTARPLSGERFLREARAVASIRSEHVVTIHQVDEANGTPYLAMELLEGEPLDRYLQRVGNVPLADVLRIG